MRERERKRGDVPKKFEKILRFVEGEKVRKLR